MGKHCQGQQEVRLDGLAPTIRSEHHGNIEFRRLSKEHGGKHKTELNPSLRYLMPILLLVLTFVPPLISNTLVLLLPYHSYTYTSCCTMFQILLRVEDVEHIFILFGKLHKPVEFKTRRYEDCLCDIAEQLILLSPI